MVLARTKVALFIILSYVVLFSLPALADERFTIGDDCATDNSTGLVWARTPADTLMTRQQALDYANGADLCGLTGWRLPDAAELEDLANAGGSDTVPWSDRQAFINELPARYWTSPDSKDSAGGGSEDHRRYVLPVRFADTGVTCSYTLSLTSDTIQVSGGTSLIGITTSSADCVWSAKSNARWLKILSGKTGVGNGTISYSVSRNKTTSQRGGTLIIAGQTFTVTQDGIKQYTISVATAGKGKGAVKSSPSGINCGKKCSKLFNEGTTVTLTAKSALGSTFEGWSGASCSATKTTCKLKDIAASAGVTATFGSPDLSGSFSPALSSAFDQNSKKYKITGSLYINNTGDGKASNVKVALYLSGDGTTYYKKDLLGSMKVGNIIVPGTPQFLDLSVMGTGTDPKGKFIIANIDSPNKVKESNENNNITISSAVQ